MSEHTTESLRRFGDAENCKYKLIFVRASELRTEGSTDTEVADAIAAAEGNE